ncbi:hypothetical protein B0H66DRAFT_641535 [Apodospora peruviana]|uniref:Biotrophy-associated secreted protein 2 n=1 Tax=Apodospora peruviana TaxID=516989 RepID=A0AAE0I1F8_9PEZI|nr:hypothetical protein B0H66DRAFT_641535 [Apodospora peruviana]
MVRIISLGALLAFAITISAQAIPNTSGARDVGNGQGLQFTTGGCVADADCQEGCCANNGEGTGICSGIGAEFQNGKQGCGFVDPNAAATIAAAKAQVAKQGF